MSALPLRAVEALFSPPSAFVCGVRNLFRVRNISVAEVTTMPGLSHITFVVRDLGRTAALFKHVFGAREVYESGERTFSLSRERFFLIGDVWVCAMEGEPLPERTYRHVAFSVPEDEFAECERRVQEAGVDVLPGRPRVPGEGRSIYFYDFDNHLFEIHVGSLGERLTRYLNDNK